MKTPPAAANIPAALAYIERHACEGLGVARLVKETQKVSQGVFVRRFQAVTGTTPRTAILRRQVEEVRRLVAATELSLSFIADHCGFRSLGAMEHALVAVGGTTAAKLRSRSPQARGRPPLIFPSPSVSSAPRLSAQ